MLLVHGATSALGLAAIQLAKTTGAKVIGTTRKSERLEMLKRTGCDIALIDDEDLYANILKEFPEGITKILELVGAAAVENSAKLLRKKGIVCITGQLGGHGSRGMDLIRLIPNGTYLCGFYSNFPNQESIDKIFRLIENHQIKPVIGRVFDFAKIAQAHAVMEKNEAMGKIVIRMPD